MKKLAIVGLLALVVSLLLSVLAPAPAQAQCTLCKTQLVAGGQDKDSYDTTGLNKGIVYLMAIPYLLIGSVGFFWYRHTNQQKKKKAGHGGV
ncbi:hypothetical protein [Hymenobacter psychrophilus]|uniref:Uncharacterized protein n=1 Tax=Hymenobacter psychrophilus TaxID=651662 RepID=A0A1H3FST2_9BACT|nr:hypothetical protein [Hymenobacter psychrophilus]SDX93905.1 hypothetical protein SAMN04488069_104209 [Hymenobacter psychrophilus]